MSAHKIPFYTDCRSAGCSKRAAWTVRNTHNDEMGRYCTPHADRLVKELQAREAAYNRSPSAVGSDDH